MGCIRAVWRDIATYGKPSFVFVATLETQGNQSYIFASNRQAAALGASQLLLEACTTWVLEACGFEGNDLTSDSERERLLTQQGDPQQSESKPYVVIATSGRAVLLSNERKRLVDVVYEVSLRALREAPGMSITAGIVEFDWESSADGSQEATLWSAMGEASKVSRQNQRYATPPETRFGRLPFLRDCDLSGYPANERASAASGVVEFRSAIVDKQIAARDRALKRIGDALRSSDASGEQPPSIAEEIDDLGPSWHAVIHADSNGFGNLFRLLGSVLPRDNLGCLSLYRKFSLDLERVTTEALTKAINGLQRQKYVYPIVFGGDDVTLVVRAEVAFKLGGSYLKEFANQASQVVNNLPVRVGAENLLPKSLSASAGIAITKPGYPFWAAYELSDDLTSAAKLGYRGRPSHESMPSCVDFHVLFDSGDTSLDSIRERRQGSDGRRLHGGPYGVPTSQDTVSNSLQEIHEAAGRLIKHRPILRKIRAALISQPEQVDIILESARTTGRLDDEDYEVIKSLTSVDASRLPDVLDLMDIGEFDSTASPGGPNGG